MTSIEWPKHSGRVADYTDAELAFVQEFVKQAEAGKITKHQAALQIVHFHDLKVEFDLDIAKDVR